MRFLVGSLFLLLWGCNQPLEVTPLPVPAFSADTIERLHQTRLLNGDEVLAQKQLLNPDVSSGYQIVNPYQPAQALSWAECNADPNCLYSLLGTGLLRRQFPASAMVYQWWIGRETAAEYAQVCGVQFSDVSQTDYRLQTFDNLAALEAEPGFILTHYQACGACSSLQDLAIYGALDLTVMAKTCSKRLTLADKKSCMQQIGFSNACAESWAYNAQQTTQSCALVCLHTYGVLALLKGEENVPPVDENGELNACLLCDEMMAGPGFQYSAGRIRRNSGILSEIDRPDDQVYSVPHAYFD